MEQNMRFVLILGRLAILKQKFMADYEQLLRPVCSCFHGQKTVQVASKAAVGSTGRCIKASLSV
jgi:hypothetical protein